MACDLMFYCIHVLLLYIFRIPLHWLNHGVQTKQTCFQVLVLSSISYVTLDKLTFNLSETFFCFSSFFSFFLFQKPFGKSLTETQISHKM